MYTSVKKVQEIDPAAQWQNASVETSVEPLVILLIMDVYLFSILLHSSMLLLGCIDVDMFEVFLFLPV